jgi:hypothetical protein
MDTLIWFIAGIATAVTMMVLWALWDYKNDTFWDDIYTGHSPTVEVKTRKVRADKGKKRKAYNKSKVSKR